MDSKRDMKDQETERISKVTAVLLKSRTGEFDLESILFLKLRGLGKIRLHHCHLIAEVVKCDGVEMSGGVCKNSSYRNILLEMFPNIRVLDGERVVGRGSDLYKLCKDIDETIKAGFYRNGQLPELPGCKPWVDNDFWEIKRSNNAIIDEAYKQFNDVLHECRLLNNRATHVISQTERSLSLKNQPKQYTFKCAPKQYTCLNVAPKSSTLFKCAPKQYTV
nr:leucine-rich repeat-containing protein 61 [Salvelinus alpinus]